MLNNVEAGHPDLKKLWCICLFLGLSLIANAKSDELYRIGVEDHSYYPLYDFKGDDEGILKTILDAFAKRKGIKFEYVPLPVKRFNSWYADEKIDFRMPDHPYWHPDGYDYLHFSNPILWVEATTVVLKKNQTLSMQDIEVLGTLVGYVASPHWQNQIAKGKSELVQEPSVKLLTKYLFKGMIDGLDVNIATVKYQATQLGYDASLVTIPKGVPKLKFAYSLSSIHYSSIIEEFNQFLESEEKTIKALQLEFGL